MTTAATALVQAERDAIMCLGVLAQAFARFDVPVDYPSETAPSHVMGLNIHAAIVDNVDGEVLGTGRNTIHADASPLQHAEQLAIRIAITRVTMKRPRRNNQSMEAYYRSSLFMGKGSQPADFLNAGATLYTTLEPCPMCASSALVCRVKRVVFLIDDAKYGGAWPMLKQHFYVADESTYGLLSISGTDSPFVNRVAQLHTAVLKKSYELRAKGIRDTHFLDFCREELNEAFDVLRSTKSVELLSVQNGDGRNANSLVGFQRVLNMPSE
jgi:tRNA(Arg) A34 adenosine deaminase TadA